MGLDSLEALPRSRRGWTQRADAEKRGDLLPISWFPERRTSGGVDAAVKVICREWASHGDQSFDWDDLTKGPEAERLAMWTEARQHLQAISAALQK